MRMKKSRTFKRRGGAATVFPLKYFDPSVHTPSAGAGHDLLKAIPPLGIRAKIGGKQKRKTRTKKQRGGFVPSVMGNFVAAASKYIVPLALFAGYKLMTKKGKRGKTAKKGKKTK